ncbi:MAG: HigA family addiction module antitoxin [Rikenellaceae bacterium]
MSTQILKPFYPVHPGEILKEEFEHRGISQKRVSEMIGVPYTMLNEILNCKRQLSTEVALMVEAAFDINADMLVNIQSRYNLQIARSDAKISKRFESIRKICASLL